MHALARLLVPALLVPIVACANGADIEPGYELEGAGGGDGRGGEGGDGGADWTASSSVSSTSADTGTGGGEGGAGGGEGGGDEGGGGEPACEYEAPAPCNGAEELPAIPGDADSDPVTRRGTTSRWFKVNIFDEFSWVPDDISYTVRLASPPGMNFDLYVYHGDKEAPNCFASGMRGQGSPEEVASDVWTDDPGTDENLWISIEVRYASGTACGSEAAWTLTIEGNTAP